MQRLLLAALAGGLMLFLWSILFQMSPLGDAGMLPLPSAAEGPADQRVLEVLRESGAPQGMYLLPWKAGESQEQMVARSKAEGWALILYHPTFEGASARLVLAELLSSIAAAFVAACLLACTPLRRLLPRAGFVAMLGLVAWLAVEVSNWNLYGFSSAFLSSRLIEQVGGFFLAGLALAKLTPALELRGRST